MSDGEFDLVFDARHLVPAWLSASLASSNDPKDDIRLYRTLQVEFYPHGIRMVACDGYMVLWSWAPALDIDKPAPELEETPLRTAIVRDVHHRAKALLLHARSLIIPELEEPVEVMLGFGDAGRSSYRGMHQLEMDGLDGEALEVEVPDRSRERIGLLQADWPNWRPVFYGFTVKRTAGLAIPPSRMRKLADLAALHDAALVWKFGGANKMAVVEIGEPPVEVRGGVMPERWNYGEEMEQG